MANRNTACWSARALWTSKATCSPAPLRSSGPATRTRSGANNRLLGVRRAAPGSFRPTSPIPRILVPRQQDRPGRGKTIILAICEASFTVQLAMRAALPPTPPPRRGGTRWKSSFSDTTRVKRPASPCKRLATLSKPGRPQRMATIPAGMPPKSRGAWGLVLMTKSTSTTKISGTDSWGRLPVMRLGDLRPTGPILGVAIPLHLAPRQALSDPRALPSPPPTPAPKRRPRTFRRRPSPTSPPPPIPAPPPPSPASPLTRVQRLLQPRQKPQPRLLLIRVPPSPTSLLTRAVQQARPPPTLAPPPARVVRRLRPA